MPRFKNIYKVTFDTKKGGDRSHLYYVEAYRKTQAEELFWAYPKIRSLSEKMHLFHVTIRKVKDEEQLDYNKIIIV